MGHLSREKGPYVEIINFEKMDILCNYKNCLFLILWIFDNCSTSRCLHFCRIWLVMAEKMVSIHHESSYVVGVVININKKSILTI